MTFRNAFLIGILLLSSLAGHAQTGAAYIDYKYTGVNPESVLPNGVKHFGGGLIGDIDADPVYGISTVAKGKTNMLWLEVSTGRDRTSSVTGWRVLDVLAFPALTKTDYLFFANDPAIQCRREGRDIPDLVGVGKISRSRGIFRPTKLWVPNLLTKKFAPVTLTGVNCEYSEP